MSSPVVSHLQYFPLNKLTPMTENIVRRRAPIKRMFLIAERDVKNAFTTCFNFGELLITLKGLSALRDLIALTPPNLLLSMPKREVARSIRDVITIIKSSQFHDDDKYGSKWNS